MRQKSDYKSYFDLPVIDFSSQFFFGVSHFWHRAKAAVGWANYDEIPVKHKRKGDGRLLLGLLPNDSFIADLFKQLSPKGLIVSCTESYEQAGCATVVPVTKTFLMEQAGIKQHHLPFKDFSAKVEPALIVETLVEMKKAYAAGETVYIHCKAGKSRSPLVAALFLAIIKLDLEYHPLTPDETFMRNLLQEKIKTISETRPQTEIDEAKIQLGVNVLMQYVDRPASKNVKIHTQSAKFYAKLTQAPEFKALSHFAYNNPQYLADIQCIMDALFDDPLQVLRSNENKNPKLDKACATINKGNAVARQLLDRLATFLDTHQNPDVVLDQSQLSQAYQHFNQALASPKYRNSEAIINIARQLQSELFLSQVYDQEKTDWLNATAKFLADPTKTNYESYYEKAETAILSENPSKSKIGKSMMYLGAAVLILTFFAGLFVISTIAPPIIVGIALGALALVMLGKLIKESDLENDVRDHSKELADKVMTVCEPVVQPFELYNFQ